MTDISDPPVSGADRIPVTVITGFLGSGKTTLLGKLLPRPDMGETAVIINEFGEIGLDHELIATSDEDMVVLNSGCLCCTVRGDLINTLRDLFLKRVRGEVPAFERLLVETTGLADPAPVLHTLMSDPLVSARYRLDGIVTTIDAVNGNRQLDEHVESVKQAAVADRLLITKPDLVDGGQLAALVTRLAGINPASKPRTVAHGDVEPSALFGAGLFDPSRKTVDVQNWLHDEAYRQEHSGHHRGHDHHPHDPNRHDDRIASFCLTFDTPFDWDRLAMWLDFLAGFRGEDLLRIKGIVNVDGLDGPVAIHGVQHLFHPPAALDGWPSEDRRSRIVFITRDLDRGVIKQTLKAMMPEKAAEAAA